MALFNFRFVWSISFAFALWAHGSWFIQYRIHKIEKLNGIWIYCVCWMRTDIVSCNEIVQWNAFSSNITITIWNKFKRMKNFEFLIYFKRFSFWQIIIKNNDNNKIEKFLILLSAMNYWCTNYLPFIQWLPISIVSLFYYFAEFFFFLVLSQRERRMQSNQNVILIDVNFIWNECGLFENCFLYAGYQPISWFLFDSIEKSE